MPILVLAAIVAALYPEPWAFALVSLVAAWIVGACFQDWVDSF